MSLGPIVEQNGGDQIAADHIEHVNAGIAATNGRDAGMEQDDRHHGNGPEAIDFRPVMHVSWCSVGADDQRSSLSPIDLFNG